MPISFASTKGQFLFILRSCFSGGFANNQMMDGEKLARRKFGAWSAGLGILIQSFFVIFNGIHRGVTLEGVFDFSSVVMLIAALTILFCFEKDKLAYRFGAITAVLVCGYTALFTLDSPESALLVFFVLPATFFFLLGYKETILWLIPIGLLLTAYCVFPQKFGKATFSTVVIFRFLTIYLVFVGYSALVQYFRERCMRELWHANTLFQSAARELKTIKGLVPVCSYCRKILDETGYWRHLEMFLKTHTQAHVSSGYCEECAKKKGKAYESGGFRVPSSLEPLISWKDTFENIQRRFVVYAGLVGSALLWGFVQRDIANGNQVQAVAQMMISGLLLVTVGILHRIKNARIGFACLIGLLFAILVHPFFLGGGEVSELYWFYLLPLFASFLLGFKIATLLSAVLLGFSYMVLFLPHLFILGEVTENTRLFFVMSFFVVSFLFLSMERLRSMYMQVLMERLSSIEQTYQSIRTVKGLVPVCRECKAIRNDNGFWTRFDRYLLEHTDLVVSHGICEACLEKEAPDVYGEFHGAKVDSTRSMPTK